MSLKLSRSGVFLAGLVVAAFALVAAGCGGDDGGGAPEALPSSACTAIEYKGDGDPDYVIASDMPMQGSSRFQTEQIVAAIRYQLEQQDWKAGDYNIGFQACDDATAQAGKWDSGKCSSNANAYVANDKPSTRGARRSRSRCSTRPLTAASRWSRRPTRSPA